MVVTDVGGWDLKPSDTKPEVVVSGSYSVRIDLQGPANSSPEKQEEGESGDLDLQSDVTLCYPCHDAVLSSTASDALQALKERSGPSLPTSELVPSPQSKVSNLRAKYDGTLPASASMPAVSKRRSQPLMRDDAPRTLNTKTPVRRPSSAMQGSLRPAARRDGPQPPRRGPSPSKEGTLKEKIGLWESRSHQDKREGRSRQLPRAVPTKNVSTSRRQEPVTIKTFDGPPPPMPSDVDSVSSQASDVKPLLYTKPSVLKTSRQMRNLVSVTASSTPVRPLSAFIRSLTCQGGNDEVGLATKKQAEL